MKKYIAFSNKSNFSNIVNMDYNHHNFNYIFMAPNYAFLFFTLTACKLLIPTI